MINKNKRCEYFVVYGQPYSKANSRRVLRLKNGKTLNIKSQNALDYAKKFKEQIKPLETLFTKKVGVQIKVYYASNRPDLDESLILDLMQGLIYNNDRQVKEKLIFWGGVDKTEPRAEITVYEL